MVCHLLPTLRWYPTIVRRRGRLPSVSAEKSMADHSSNQRADSAVFSEDDPFAELTRIMGHDPRRADHCGRLLGECSAGSIFALGLHFMIVEVW